MKNNAICAYKAHNKYSFLGSQFSSFHRMLNLYGFSKQSTGKYEGAFKHPQFHRDISTEDTIVARVVKRK